MQLATLAFGALLASGSAFAAITGTPTAARAVHANSGIFTAAGKVVSPGKPENSAYIPTGTVNLALPAPVPVHISLTNAERLRRGLSPKAPTRKRTTAHLPRSSCGPVASLGFLEVYDSSSYTKLGYVSRSYDSQNSYTFSPLEDEAQLFTIPIIGQYNRLIDITAVDGPDNSFPFFGGVGGSGGYELASGTASYVYLSGVGLTEPGSTPSYTAGNSIEALGYTAPSESTIFALSCNLELGVQWVNDIGYTTASAQTFFYDPTVDYLGISADVGAFTDEFPNEGAIPVVLKYSPL